MSKKITGHEILNQTIEDLIVKDIRSEKYTNVLFDYFIYINRKIVRDYQEVNSVISVGRFGKWNYFLSNQGMLSGSEGITSY